MKQRGIVYALIGALILAVGLPVLATVNVPHAFTPGSPIRSSEVNANFRALVDAIEALGTAKQEAITGGPCDAGQIVRNVTAAGTLECDIDQVGASGDAGVGSLNGLSGSITIEAGPNVNVTTSQDGRITIGATGGGGGFAGVASHAPLTGDATSANPLAVADGGVTAAMLATSAAPSATNQVLTWTGSTLAWQTPPGAGGLALPYEGNAALDGAALQITNGGTGNAIVGLTSTGKTGVYGHNTNPEARSVGVWGRTEAAGTFGVYGSSANGYGVHGVSTSNAGVVGVSTSYDGMAGVSQSGRGVRGESISGIGVLGLSTSGAALHGVSQSGYGVQGATQTGTAGVYGTTALAGGAGILGVDGANHSIAVRGNATRTGSVDVWGQAISAAGVIGRSETGAGVWGRSTSGPAMQAEGYAVQSLGAGGWAKAAVYVRNGVIERCFNSQATTPSLVQGGTCGITIARGSTGSRSTQSVINFGFDVRSTFPVLTLTQDCFTAYNVCVGNLSVDPRNSNWINVVVTDLDSAVAGEGFFLVLY